MYFVKICIFSVFNYDSRVARPFLYDLHIYSVIDLCILLLFIFLCWGGIQSYWCEGIHFKRPCIILYQIITLLSSFSSSETMALIVADFPVPARPTICIL